MKNILKNKKGNANTIILAIFTVISGFALLTIGSYIYFAISSSADPGTQVIASSGREAHATFTMTGNGTCGSHLNITNASGQLINLRFNVSTGCNEVPRGSLNVTVTLGGNGSVFTAQNITAVLNSNVSFSQEMTATNATNQTIITYNTKGTTGNTVTLSEDFTNGAFSGDGTALYDGTAQISGQTTQNSLNSYVVVVFPLFGLALMILGFGVLYMTMRKSFGVQGR